MAAVVTYNSLVQSVQDYLEHPDSPFITQIPLFIMLGQRRIARDLKILGTKAYALGTCTPGNQVITKFTNWLSTTTFSIGTGVGFGTTKQVLKRSLEFAEIYAPNVTDLYPPKYYVDDYKYNEWLIYPTPDLAYPYKIGYYQIPSLIDENQQTNFLTINAPDIVLYATLFETASYLKDDDRIAVWKSYYETAKAALTTEDMNRIYDGYSKRGG